MCLLCERALAYSIESNGAVEYSLKRRGVRVDVVVAKALKLEHSTDRRSYVMVRKQEIRNKEANKSEKHYSQSIIGIMLTTLPVTVASTKA